MNQRPKYRYVIIIVILVVSYYVTNKIFKVNYSEDDVVLVDNLEVNDSLTISKAFIVLGKNYKGFIEATVFPALEDRYHDLGIVEYYYLRFPPSWFNENISPRVTEKYNNREKLSFDLVAKAKKAHDDNFEYCCHYSAYPIVNENLLFTRISLVGVADKISIFTDLNR